MKLTKEHVDAAVLGGAVLGGGGGGWPEDGRRLGCLALEVGDLVMREIGDVPDDTMLVTAGVVGAPSAPESHVKPIHYLRALQLLEQQLSQPISGVIANENGGAGTLNGWFQSAVLGLPVIDAACNGRAHPTTMMGAMGLDRTRDYVARAAGCGGKEHTDQYLELYAEGAVSQVASIIRHASTVAGGMIAIARNPVRASYVREHGAPGAIRQAIDLGMAMLEKQPQGPEAVTQGAANYLRGEVICRGHVAEVVSAREGGFDKGRVVLKEGDAQYELTFLNEYMTLESDGQRLATFPGLIVTMSLETGLPVASAELDVGQSIAVLCVPEGNLILGDGMRDADLFVFIEQALGKEIINYAFPHARSDVRRSGASGRPVG